MIESPASSSYTVTIDKSTWVEAVEVSAERKVQTVGIDKTEERDKAFRFKTRDEAQTVWLILRQYGCRDSKIEFRNEGAE